MEEERKKLLFVFVFSTYLPVFLLKFQPGELVGCRIWFRIQRVPTLYTFDGPRYPKNKKYLMTSSRFFRYFLFLGSKVRQKYAKWVLVGCRIKFRIQRALPIENWVKTRGDMSKIQIKKVVFFFSSSKINKYYFIILLIFLGGPFWVEIFSNVCKMTCVN